jgi:hypothetical protein
MDSDYYTNNKEAAVIGALLADELYLQGVDKNQTSIPHFKVMDYDSWAGTPSQIFIDRDLDGKADGEANIIYDFSENCKRSRSIEIATALSTRHLIASTT